MIAYIMSLALVYSRTNDGIHAPLVTVEVNLSNGLPYLSIVGLPETAVRESKDRVRAAITNSRFEFPNRNITINLAPADIPKDGGRFDLPIALGILAASGQIPEQALADYEFIGELSLGGLLRKVNGVLPTAIRAHQAKRALFVPEENADEACLISELPVYTADHLLKITEHLKGITPLVPYQLKNGVQQRKYAVDLN